MQNPVKTIQDQSLWQLANLALYYQEQGFKTNLDGSKHILEVFPAEA